MTTPIVLVEGMVCDLTHCTSVYRLYLLIMVTRIESTWIISALFLKSSLRSQHRLAQPFSLVNSSEFFLVV